MGQNCKHGLTELYCAMCQKEKNRRGKVEQETVEIPKSHTPLEIANAIDRWIKGGRKVSQIAAALKRSLEWVYRYRQVANLTPEVQALMDPALPYDQRLRILIALMLVSLPSELQVTLAHEVIKGGMSVNAARQHIRRRTHEQGFIAGSPSRTPTKDHANLLSSLRGMRERVVLLLAMEPGEMAAMFTHRDADYEEVLRELKELRSKFEDLERRFLKLGDQQLQSKHARSVAK